MRVSGVQMGLFINQLTVLMQVLVVYHMHDILRSARKAIRGSSFAHFSRVGLNGAPHGGIPVVPATFRLETFSFFGHFSIDAFS